MLNNQDFTGNRAHFIGGNDVAAILGLSPYRTPVDVWLEKTGQSTNNQTSMAMRFGQFAEEFIAQEYSRATQQAVTQYEEAFTDPDHQYLAGHIDRFVLPKNGDLFHSTNQLAAQKLLECKTANPFAQQEWGDAGTDSVPMSHLIQCLWYLMLTGCESADLAVLFGNSDFRIYTIFRDKEIESILREKACHFWEQYVQTKIAPPVQNEADCRSLFEKSIPSKAKEADQYDLELLEQLKNANHQLLSYEKQISSIKQVLMQSLQDAESLQFEGRSLVTWKTPKPSKKFDSKQFAQDYPELASQYQVEIANSRRFVVKEL